MLRPTIKVKEKGRGYSTCSRDGGGDEKEGTAAASSKVLENLKLCVKDLGLVSGSRLATKENKKTFVGTSLKREGKEKVIKNCNSHMLFNKGLEEHSKRIKPILYLKRGDENYKVICFINVTSMVFLSHVSPFNK